MQTKLTLSLEADTIKQAKEYARKHNKSISQIVEAYFKNLTEKENPPSSSKLTPLTDSLAGFLKGIQINDLTKERTEYLEKKFIKQ